MPESLAALAVGPINHYRRIAAALPGQASLAIIRPMFSPEVLDHFKHPRNPGELPAATAVVEVTNPVCADILQLSVRIEAGRVAEARFMARGCVTAMACSSLLTELATGKTRAELAQITPDQISAALGGLPVATFHGAQLACDAIAGLLAELGN
jgi:nitrogen fixation protein NifU and related proteins